MATLGSQRFPWAPPAGGCGVWPTLPQHGDPPATISSCGAAARCKIKIGPLPFLFWLQGRGGAGLVSPKGTGRGQGASDSPSPTTHSTC